MTDYITISPSRLLGSIFVDCTIEENHVDSLEITDHPVEQGPFITDHSFLRPAECTMYIGYTNSSKKAAADEGYVNRVYASLLELQKSRIPFRVATGKRVYQNMLIKSMSVTNDEKTEAALFVTVSLRQIIIANVTTVKIAPKENQADPQKTAPPIAKGTVQARQSPPNFSKMSVDQITQYFIDKNGTAP